MRCVPPLPAARLVQPPSRTSHPLETGVCTAMRVDVCWLPQALAKLMADMQNPEFAKLMEESLRTMGGPPGPGLPSGTAAGMPGAAELGLDTDADKSIAATLQMLAKMSTETGGPGGTLARSPLMMLFLSSALGWAYCGDGSVLPCGAGCCVAPSELLSCGAVELSLPSCDVLFGLHVCICGILQARPRPRTRSPWRRR